MKKIIPNLRKIAAKKGYNMIQLAAAINELQIKAGYTKRHLTYSGLYSYARQTPPQYRIYAICAILDIHPRKLFKDVYNEEKLAKYKILILTP